ncbi:hypothetical protein T11_12729 [Trichinella zimbabwensis]|uniref:Uncharacterized protein n=1 Tax=Trichinella zimbabwensis TaxID=268475 RepID=A0A0V1GCA2_9BILA|nr:hypothetical protein T11_12729 [Trichinella zimbabwensis]
MTLRELRSGQIGPSLAVLSLYPCWCPYCVRSLARPGGKNAKSQIKGRGVLRSARIILRGYGS